MTLNDHVYLYVEDDMLSREAMKAIFNRVLGIQTLSIFPDSTDFAEKLAALDPRPTVFLLDVHVHPIDGFEMVKVIRSNPEFKEAMIIALTASVMNDQLDEIRRGGFNSAIAKPLSVSQFPKVLENILKGEAIWHIA